MARKKANYPLVEGLEITTLAAEGKMCIRDRIMQAGRRAELFSAGPVSIPLYPVKRRKTKILHLSLIHI